MPVQALDPVEQADAVNVAREQQRGRDDGPDHGHPVVLVPHAGALDREQIGPGDAADDRHDQKSGKPQPAQAENVAQDVFGKTGD